MKRMNNKKVMSVLLTLLVMSALCVTAVLAADMTIKGTISDDGKLQAENGEEYTIAENPKGLEVMGLAGESVTIKGAVTDNEGEKIISVTSYSVQEERRERD